MKFYPNTLARLTLRAVEQDLYPRVLLKPFIIVEQTPHKTPHYSVLCDDNKFRVVQGSDIEEDK